VGFGRRNYLFEVKQPTAKLNALQKAWHATWRGKAHLVRSPEEAIAVVAYWGNP
jgi:hypothetical protein